MEAVGLITEYNPFHNGHIHHLQTAKKASGADVVIAIMSGNFVQRGEPAIVDKWVRADAALQAGVDIVLELPFQYAVQAAHIFAKGAVQSLAAMQVKTLVFGAEHAELDFLTLAKQAKASLQASQKFTSFNETYATSFNQVIYEQTGIKIQQPNDMLAFAYATAINDLGLTEQIQLQPIQRIKAGYHDQKIQDKTIASASALRALVETGKVAELANYLPESLVKELALGGQVEPFMDLWFDYLKYKVLTTPVAELEKIYQLGDGLAYRLKKTLTISINWSEFQQAFKSKRYTWARLQRTLLYVLLNITTEEMMDAWQTPYLRILGTTVSGRQYLKQERENITLPVINRVTKADVHGRLKLDIRAGQVYQQMSKPYAQKWEQDFKRQALLIKGE